MASFLIEAVGAYFIAKAVTKLGTNIYRAFFSDEEMSDKKRGEIVGSGIFDLGLSTFSLWKGAKSFFGGFKNMFQMTNNAWKGVQLANKSGNLMNGSVWTGNWWGQMTAPLTSGGIFATMGNQISKGWTETGALWSKGWDKMKGWFNTPKTSTNTIRETEGLTSNATSESFVPVKALRPYEIEAMDRFRAAFKAGNLPKNYGMFIEKPLSTDAMRMLSQEFGGIEVAQVYYMTGPKSGYTNVYFGTKNSISLPQAVSGETQYLISHTHPGGTITPSVYDVDVLKNIQNAQKVNNSPIQSSSTIVPSGSKNVKFNNTSNYNAPEQTINNNTKISNLGANNTIKEGGRFLSAEELAKRLNTTVKDYHTNIKPIMKKDFAQEMKKIGTTNPDFSPNDLRNVMLKNPQTGKVIHTDVPFDAYIP